jgi:hypothetical protein
MEEIYEDSYQAEETDLNLILDELETLRGKIYDLEKELEQIKVLKKELANLFS